MSKNTKRCQALFLFLQGWGVWAGLLGIAADARADPPMWRGLETPPHRGAAELLAGVRAFFARTACDDGSFHPGMDPTYPGMADSAYSDLAPVTYAVILHMTFGWQLPDEAKTRRFLLARQGVDGAFRNERGTADPRSAQARVYNTTQGLVALHALGEKPRYDPLPVFAEVLKENYKTLAAYTTSFFPLAYEAYGKPLPPEADRRIRALMVPAEDGYLHEHIAATFHMVHYYRLIHEPPPRSEAILRRVLHEQKPDGSWLLNQPSRDRHATFDAVFVLRQLGGGRPECRRAIARASAWALSCRNADGGFGHLPGSTSDADAVYFQLGTLVMAGLVEPSAPPPKDPHLLGWGHLFPLPSKSERRRSYR